MDFIQKIVGGKSAQAPAQADDSDFAEFAGAPAPQPISIPASPADAQRALPTNPYGSSAPAVYTKWYRVWERTTLDDFRMEMYLLPLILLALLVHFLGTGRNKRKARKWAAVHTPVLENEFALVGFSNQLKTTPYADTVQAGELLESSAKLGPESLVPDTLKEKSAFEFESYATGRLNVAFVDFKIHLKKWYNPFVLIAEHLTGLFFESLKPQPERMEAVIYTFDGNEKNFVAPAVPGSEEISGTKAIPNSTYDQFIFAIVHKMSMRKLRDERYDLSLTFTKDHAKLPNWVSVMSEAAEVTETLLTKDIISAVEKAGDAFRYLIVTDQPIEKPTTLDEAVPKKKIQLCLELPSDDNYLPSLYIFQAFLRLPDFLAGSAKFRPEVMKKINSIRETEKSKMKKVKELEVEEERKALLDKSRKEERDRKMKGLSAEEQRKFLEREAAKDRKKQEKKMSRRG